MTAIDVLLPVRFPAPWLRETLEGLASQDIDDWRLVAVIHGKDYGLSELILSFNFPTNIHLAGADSTLAEVLNFGISKCSAPYIARLDADDIPVPSRLREQHDCLEANPQCAIVVSPAVEIDAEGHAIGVRSVPFSSEKLLRILPWKNCIIHPAVMFRRMMLLDAGGYAPLARHTEDYELWLRLLAAHDPCICPVSAIKYRIHGGQVTSTRFIGGQARSKVFEARIAFAKGRGISAHLVRLQHGVWSLRQILRTLTRRRKGLIAT